MRIQMEQRMAALQGKKWASERINRIDDKWKQVWFYLEIEDTSAHLYVDEKTFHIQTNIELQYS